MKIVIACAALCVAVSATSELHIKGKDGQIKFTEPGPGIPECVFKKEHCEAARHAAATRIGLEKLEKQFNALASQQAVMQSHMTTVAKLLCPKHVPSNTVLDPAGARAVDQAGLCRYDCAPGHEDADGDGKCTKCLDSCPAGYELSGTCSTSSETSCKRIEHYCSGAPAATVVVNMEQIKIVGRHVGATAQAACNGVVRALCLSTQMYVSRRTYELYRNAVLGGSWETAAELTFCLLGG